MDNKIPAEEYCAKVFDGTHDTPKPVPNGKPLITSKHLCGNHLAIEDAYHIADADYYQIQKRSAVSQWDVLFSMIGTVGTVYLEKSTDIPYAIKNIGVFSCKNEHKAKFLFYYLQSPAALKHIQNYLSQTVQKFLPLGALREFPVLPFDDHKNKGIDLLYLLDEKSELNNKVNMELERLAKLLYDYWFIQFDFPDENNRPYKTSGGEMVYNPILKRQIPAGWGVTTFKEWISEDKGGDWGEEAPTEKHTYEATCIRGADFPSLSECISPNAPVRYILEKSKSRVLAPGDLIIEISGGSPTQSTGRICYINHVTLKRFNTAIITSNFCKAISLKSPQLTYIFYLEWQRLYAAGAFFNYEGKTTGLKNLLFDIFTVSHKIVSPPIGLIEKFHNTVSPLFEAIQHNALEAQELTKLRDWLLPMLMNGQVKVK